MNRNFDSTIKSAKTFKIVQFIHHYGKWGKKRKKRERTQSPRSQIARRFSVTELNRTMKHETKAISNVHNNNTHECNNKHM